jgi:hypothetical protein
MSLFKLTECTLAEFFFFFIESHYLLVYPFQWTTNLQSTIEVELDMNCFEYNEIACLKLCCTLDYFHPFSTCRAPSFVPQALPSQTSTNLRGGTRHTKAAPPKLKRLQNLLETLINLTMTKKKQEKRWERDWRKKRRHPSTLEEQ